MLWLAARRFPAAGLGSPTTAAGIRSGSLAWWFHWAFQGSMIYTGMPDDNNDTGSITRDEQRFYRHFN